MRNDFTDRHALHHAGRQRLNKRRKAYGRKELQSALGLGAVFPLEGETNAFAGIL